MSAFHFCRAVARAVVRVLFSIRFEGLENLPPREQGGYLLCSNHLHALDPVIISLPLAPKINFMAKEELFKKKFFANMLTMLGAFPVSRGKGDVSSVRHAVELVKNGGILGIFPEGTRSKTGELGRLKAGVLFIAAQTEGNILPCVIKKGKKFLWRQQLTVRYGKMIESGVLGLSGVDRKALKGATTMLTETMNEMLEKNDG